MKLRVTGTSEVQDVELAPPELPRGAVAARDGAAVWVAFGGGTYRVERVTARPGRRSEAAEHDLRAPMPGRVLRVHVAAGQEVAKGAPLLVLEAMKMEHEVKAPRDGVVARLLCKAGEMVGLGDVLVELS